MFVAKRFYVSWQGDGGQLIILESVFLQALEFWEVVEISKMS